MEVITFDCLAKRSIVYRAIHSCAVSKDKYPKIVEIF